jgi:glycyl-tRNA synthetase beta chain
VRIEEKRDGVRHDGAVDEAALAQAEEIDLSHRLKVVWKEAGEKLDKEDFVAGMTALAALRGQIDAFFDKVTVNADDAKLRANRLKLLSQIRATMNRVADFSEIEG